MGPLGEQLENISPAAFLPGLSLLLISLVHFVPHMSLLFPLHQSWFKLDTALHDRNMGVMLGMMLTLDFIAC